MNNNGPQNHKLSRTSTPSSDQPSEYFIILSSLTDVSEVIFLPIIDESDLSKLNGILEDKFSHI